MEIVAVMATYPGRRDDCLLAAESIAAQVDRLVLVLNEYTNVPEFLPMDTNIEYILPDADLKDTGKFCEEVSSDDFVFLCDDDIKYPMNYVNKMMLKHNAYRKLGAVVGVHGVTYSDFFDGDAAARLVFTFNRALRLDTFVNQLGTGTVLCRGSQMPSFDYMSSSQRFVDLRFARFCAERKSPMVCVERPDEWLTEISRGPSIFDTYTKHWELDTVRESQAIAGFRFLPAGSPADHLRMAEVD